MERKTSVNAPVALFLHSIHAPIITQAHKKKKVVCAMDQTIIFPCIFTR